jgi:hypothetical protein
MLGQIGTTAIASVGLSVPAQKREWLDRFETVRS